jgi:hypothetical protein
MQVIDIAQVVGNKMIKKRSPQGGGGRFRRRNEENGYGLGLEKPDY